MSEASQQAPTGKFDIGSGSSFFGTASIARSHMPYDAAGRGVARERRPSLRAVLPAAVSGIVHTCLTSSSPSRTITSHRGSRRPIATAFGLARAGPCEHLVVISARLPRLSGCRVWPGPSPRVKGSTNSSGLRPGLGA